MKDKNSSKYKRNIIVFLVLFLFVLLFVPIIANECCEICKKKKKNTKNKPQFYDLKHVSAAQVWKEAHWQLLVHEIFVFSYCNFRNVCNISELDLIKKKLRHQA